MWYGSSILSSDSKEIHRMPQIAGPDYISIAISAIHKATEAKEIGFLGGMDAVHDLQKGAQDAQATAARRAARAARKAREESA
jgi:hypothetical protein